MMNHLLFAVPVLALAAAAALTSCADTPAASLRPATPTFADAAKATGCAIIDGRNEPFVVDWPADRRADLEAALKNDVAVVAYSCQTIRVLPDCAIKGSYRYTSVTEKEQVLKLEDADEIRANLPLSGLKIAGRLSGDLERGSTLDIALAIAGKKAASRGLVLTSDLTGECTGATHYVRSATLGAFAMQTGTRAQVHTAAELFGGSASAESASSAKTSSRDGQLEACRAVSPAADVAIPQCAAPLRLELRAVRSAPPETRPEGHAPDESNALVCPTGTRPSDEGKCIASTSTAPHICAPDDLSDCTAQCDKGSMSSCAILGRMYEVGRGVAQDLAKAVPLFDRACKGGATPACGRLGELLVRSGRRDDGLALLRKSCDAGFGDACVAFAQTVVADPKNKNVDVVPIVHRDCASGHASSCGALAMLFHEGLGVRQNDGEFFRYATMACEGDAPGGCALVARAYEEGRGADKDLTKAASVSKTACDRGASESCNALSMMYFQGNGVTKSEADGVAYLTRACEGDDRGSCLPLGMRYRTGTGVVKDAERATRYLTRACEAGIAMACAAARQP